VDYVEAFAERMLRSAGKPAEGKATEACAEDQARQASAGEAAGTWRAALPEKDDARSWGKAEVWMTGKVPREARELLDSLARGHDLLIWQVMAEGVRCFAEKYGPGGRLQSAHGAEPANGNGEEA
jgi:hypothetical protein